MPLLAEGDRISDDLVVDRLIGEGAFAEVHRVEHAYLGRQALKLFKRVGGLAETRALLGEARLLSVLGHPNVIRLFDAGTVSTPDGMRGWFTMEYVAGGSLEGFLRSHRRGVPVDVAVEVVEQLVAGLQVAHDQDPPIVHRDLTIANVLVGYDAAGMRARISDFGLAKRADPISGLASAQGTYAFMAPEVLRNEGYSRAGDVWSVGTIAYLLLTGTFPFDDGGRFSSFALDRFRRALLPPSRFHADVDPELDRIVLGLLALDPRDRPQDAGAVGRAFAERRRHRDAAPPKRADGDPDPEPSARAARLLAEAHELARRPGTLVQAGDLLEEAINLAPELRDRHLPALTRWRRGVVL